MLRISALPSLAAYNSNVSVSPHSNARLQGVLRNILQRSSLRAAALIAAPVGVASGSRGGAAENAAKPLTPLLSPVVPKKAAKKSWWEILKRLSQYISWKDAILLCAAAGMLAAAALAGVSIPVLLGQLQLGFGGPDAWMLFVKLGAVVLGSFLAKVAATWCLSAALEDIQASWKMALFQAQLNMDMEQYDASSSSAETISRVSSEVREIKSTLRRVMTTGITAAAQTAGGLASLFMISPQLTTGLGLVLVPAVWLANTLGSSLRSQSSRSHAAIAEADSHAAEALSSIRTVRSCTAEHEEMQRYQGKVGRAAEHSLWLSRGAGMFDAAMGLGVYSIVAGLMAAGASLVGSGDLLAADLAGYMLQAVRLQGSLGALSMTASKLNQASGSAAKVVQVLDDAPKVNTPGGVKWKPFRGEITFQDVRFTYPARPRDPVLKGMSFTIPPGKTVALVGSSGAGKSTILSLLERFYSVDEGSILIDGREVSHIDAHWLRSRTAVVPQSPTLFGGLTIDENVRYGNPSASADDVSAALKSADCDFVESLPKGRHTLVGERGVSLSGGQRQRLAIARALLREPSILCLDEYTSALDAHTEENLASSIASLAHSKTCIIIAHRLATVKSADLILVLKDGQVVEQGTHTELVQKAGPYADMVQKQLL